jgi:hypothetical protein
VDVYAIVLLQSTKHIFLIEKGRRKDVQDSIDEKIVGVDACDIFSQVIHLSGALLASSKTDRIGQPSIAMESVRRKYVPWWTRRRQGET